MARCFLLAPNAFKGSISAFDFCSVLSRELEERGFRAVSLPLGDGGDGTAEVVAHYLGAGKVETVVPDALGRPHTARYYRQGNTAVLELAEACGLKWLKKQEYDVTRASTRGFGSLINHALGEGARELVLCVGGSASVDGGIGALREMGLLTEGWNGDGNGLTTAGGLDPILLQRKFEGIRTRVLCDVENPLLGPTGAAAVFAPQKGASPEQVAWLEELLTRYADELCRVTGKDVRTLPRGGAAGGIAASFHALLGTELVSGSEYCLEISRFRERLQEADAVVTGEGRLDRQSLDGKIPGTVARVCRREKVPVYAVAGMADREVIGCFDRVFTLSAMASSVTDSIKNAPYYLKLTADALVDACYMDVLY